MPETGGAVARTTRPWTRLPWRPGDALRAGSRSARRLNRCPQLETSATMGAGASVEGDAKPKFIYLPVVGRGEQIRLKLRPPSTALTYETVLPAGGSG